MKFIEENGPHIKTPLSVSKIMRNLCIALTPIILFAFYKNGLKPFLDGNYTVYGMIYPLLVILTGIISGVVIELLYALIFKKQKIKEYMKSSYSFLPGIFIALIAPLNTPLYLIALATAIGIIIKIICGGFGKNIFNPALIGYIVLFLFFGSVITNAGGIYNPSELDGITTATPLSFLAENNYLVTNDDITANYSYQNLLFGFYPGAPGETSTILILLALIFLFITKTIKWRIPCFYLATVFIMTLIIGLYNDLDITYPIFHIITGGLLFGAVFMATDPVTSPITKSGQVLFAVFLGLITVAIRFLSIYPEGVMISILIMNVFIFILDKISIEKNIFKVLSLVITTALVIMLSFYIANRILPTEEEKNPNIDTTFKVNDTKVDGDISIYDVTAKSFYEINAKITIENEKVLHIEIVNQHETYWDMVEDNDYINQILDNQDNLSDLDTISGATRTTKGLKDMVSKTLDYHNDKR